MKTASIKTLSQNLLGGTEKNNKIPSISSPSLDPNRVHLEHKEKRAYDSTAIFGTQDTS